MRCSIAILLQVVAALSMLASSGSPLAAESFPSDTAIERAVRDHGSSSVPLPFGDAQRQTKPLDRFLNRPDAATEPSPTTAVLVFVSFAMPEASLKRLAADASRIGAVLMLRGLKDDSLEKTRAALAPIVASTNPAPTFQIHPQAFTTFAVTAVPTIVVGQSVLADARPRFAGVVGDVTLAYALERIARTGGDLAPLARSRAAQLRGRRTEE